MQIICNIATTGSERRHTSLKKVIECLQRQTVKPDDLNIYNNRYEPNDYTDLGKFYYLHQYKDPVYYFTMDDDIDYPVDYIETTLKHLKYYEDQSIITYHGRRLKGLSRSYYRGHHSSPFHAYNEKYTQVDVSGTGVQAFSTAYFNPTNLFKSPYARMSDLVFALSAAQNHKQIIIPPRRKEWITAIDIRQPDSCIMRHLNDEAYQRELADQIYIIRNNI